MPTSTASEIIRRMRFYVHALRVARPRQLRARSLRPARRRRFPKGDPPRRLAPLPAARALWLSEAFAA